VRTWLYRGAGVLLMLTLLGAAYEAVTEYRDHRRFPNRGCPIDVNGHKLNLNCSGQGSPTVVLEAAMTGLSSAWQPIQTQVSGFTRVCSYDRAGYGWSDPGSLPRTSRQISQELHALLAHAGEAPPYILVGASAGGFHVRVYAGSYPIDVAGMVLVDSSHPDQAAKFGFPENPLQEQERWRRLLPVFHHLGLLRLSFDLENRPAAFPKANWDEMIYLRDSAESMRTLLNEAEGWAVSAEQVRQSGTVGDKPLIVLTGSRDLEPNERKIWVDDLQAGLARLSSRGKQVLLNKNGHGIQFENPDAIVSAIREVYDTVKQD
jgi:pimeloyl-ACP methyl ester carboxylesterase